MDSSLFKKVEQFVSDAYRKAGNREVIKHFDRTAYWVKQFKPDADEALLIAAFGHDAERAFSKKNISSKSENDDYHQIESARIIIDFLKTQKADQKLIGRVKMLIERHEVGGDEDQNLLMDADSISYFENNIDLYIKIKLEKNGKKKIKEKFDWMFNRIISEKAKQIARPWYEEALKKLEKV